MIRREQRIEMTKKRIYYPGKSDTWIGVGPTTMQFGKPGDGNFLTIRTSECSICVNASVGGRLPSHDGWFDCKSGSISSGGKISHCRCNICFSD